MRDEVQKAFSILEIFLANAKWMAGDHITIADFSILGMITTFKEMNADFAMYPKLNDWFERCKGFEGFEQNLEGAKFLAGRLFAILDEKSI